MKLSRQATHKLLVGVVILILALLSTYPAFSGHFFAINNDGDVHLARLEAIYQAFKAGHFPSLINFIGFAHHGIAINAMYPWLTLLIYVIPRFLFQSPMLGLAVGFLLMNLFTIINSYWLAKSLSRNRLIIWLGVLVYQFNAYHFQLMYARIAIGEAFGYAFLPLVMFGLFQIWQNRKFGSIWLAIGMSLVGNSHILSLLLFVILIAILELIRMISRKFTLNELKQLLLAAAISLLMTSYSLYNVIVWGLHNRMVTPTPTLIGLNPVLGFSRILANDISETATGAHMGIAVTLILLYLAAQLISQPTGEWRYWIIGAISLWLLAQNWINWAHFATTPASLLQFTMRILTIVALLAMIGLILFLNQHNWHSVATTVFGGLFLIFVGISGVTQIHNHTAQDYQWAQHHTAPVSQVKRQLLRHLTGRNYLQNVNNMTLPDYHLRKIDLHPDPNFKPQTNQSFPAASRENKKTVDFDPQSTQQFHDYRASDQSVEFSTKHKHSRAQSVKLPVIGYNHVNYNVTVNGKSTHYWRSGGQLKAELPKGRSNIKVSVANQSRHVILLLLTVLTYLIALGYMLFDRFKRTKTHSLQGKHY